MHVDRPPEAIGNISEPRVKRVSTLQHPIHVRKIFTAHSIVESDNSRPLNFLKAG